MPEYIDREKYCAEVCRCNKEKCDKSKCPVWNAPAADVAPVVHAKWEIHEVDCFTKFAICTACGERAVDIPEGIHEQGFNITAHKPVLTRYCPYCGAKMDLEDDKQ